VLRGRSENDSNGVFTMNSSNVRLAIVFATLTFLIGCSADRRNDDAMQKDLAESTHVILDPVQHANNKGTEIEERLTLHYSENYWMVVELMNSTDKPFVVLSRQNEELSGLKCRLFRDGKQVPFSVFPLVNPYFTFNDRKTVAAGDAFRHVETWWCYDRSALAPGRYQIHIQYEMGDRRHMKNGGFVDGLTPATLEKWVEVNLVP